MNHIGVMSSRISSEAWPGGVAVRLWAGYTFDHMDEGPPGQCGNGRPGSRAMCHIISLY